MKTLNGFEIPEHYIHYARKHEIKDGVVQIEAKVRKFRKKLINPASCVFNATEEFLKALGLGILDSHDREFFETIKGLAGAGTPVPLTPFAIQGVVEPYGLRVTRVRVPKWYPINQQLRVWQRLLGFADPKPDHPDADKLFGFEIADEPLRPSIVGTAPELSLHGHAWYLAPRAPCDKDWHISIQVGRVNDYPWLYGKPDPVETVNEEIEVEEPDWAATFGFGYTFPGWPYWGSDNWNWWDKPKKKKKMCLRCGANSRAYSLVCAPCWVEAWSAYRCSECKVEFKDSIPELSRPAERDKLFGRCKCGKEYHVKYSPKKVEDYEWME